MRVARIPDVVRDCALASAGEVKSCRGFVGSGRCQNGVGEATPKLRGGMVVGCWLRVEGGAGTTAARACEFRAGQHSDDCYENSRGQNAAATFFPCLLFRQLNDFFEAPNVVRDSRFHRGRDAQRLMDFPEIVEHVVKRQHGGLTLSRRNENRRVIPWEPFAICTKDILFLCLRRHCALPGACL
jgi:hypothetical protein